MDKEACALNLYNGLTRHYINARNHLFNKKIACDIELNDIKNALITLLAFDVLFHKETMVEQETNNIQATGNITYLSKMSDEFIEILLKLVNKVGKEKEEVDIFPNGATVLAVIRNKLAHGDYCVDEDDIIFYKNNQEVRINVYKFFQMYLELTNMLDARIVDSSYTKCYLENKGSLVIDKPIETDEDLFKFLSLLELKNYTLRRKDGKCLRTEEKVMLKNEIYSIEEISRKNDNAKVLEKLIQDYYHHAGYDLIIDSKKIDDLLLIERIKKIIKINNEFYKENKELSIGDLIYGYGNDIYKLIVEEYEQAGLQYGNKLNFAILRGSLLQENTNVVEVLKKSSPELLEVLKSSYNEFFAAIALGRFYGLYCYPFDDIYKQENKYHLFRDDELDFSKLDLSDIKPNVLVVEEKGLDEAKLQLLKVAKEINSVSNRIHVVQGFIDGISKKGTLTEPEAKKLNQFRLEIIEKTKQLNYLYDLYLEYQVYYQEVENDYKNHPDYFRNRAIIEGMRNALAHGNVTVENIAETMYVNETVLKFTDLHEGKICFQASVSLYDLELLFEQHNIDALADFFENKMKNNDKKHKKINC